jgi:hypothetical protein
VRDATPHQRAQPSPTQYRVLSRVPQHANINYGYFCIWLRLSLQFNHFAHNMLQFRDWVQLDAGAKVEKQKRIKTIEQNNIIQSSRRKS